MTRQVYSPLYNNAAFSNAKAATDVLFVTFFILVP